ncbi:hypothetical protein A3I84_02175 [Candidatus Nomurabacteria bacterium RIFCSPLOWO2_02_FULL_36_8]|nr:MAG: hypothetical protein A3I84_02175 [Candidatus Nomurabacteria bacterium RIFCSPLOWO2_02_FULL_36_8]
MRKSTDGSITTDLAESYNISKDGSSYTFVLKDKIYFHDGQPVTADDVIFTIKEVKDPIIKSPYKGNWDGVTVEKKDDKTLVFTLKQPYALFLENMTLGIMPAHLWDNTPLELNDANTKPIGSGPYMINAVNKQSSGIIDYYELTPFKKFILGEPYIENINLYFYQNENDLIKALVDKKIEAISSITPINAEDLKEKNYQVESIVLSRVFGLFFNQNANHLFTDKNIVAAINQAIDKDKIVRDVLLGYGVTIDDPIPPNMIKYHELEDKEPISRKDLLEKAQNNLSKDGWKIGADGFLEKTTTEKKKKVVTKLEFSISTGSVPELVKTAELIKQDLAVIGIKVDIKIFETGNLNQNVIRPRKYDALLFGTIINRESDLFAFWHSSQRKDPGLNVAMYTNAKVDKILEDAFVSLDEQSRIKKYIQFSEEIKKDMPAVFLYSPDFIYIVPKNLKEPKIDQIISPSDRYLNVHLWYTQTEKVWKIFIKTKNKTNTY